MGAYHTGEYRSLFEKIGKSREETQKKLEAIVHTFFTEVRRNAFIMKPAAAWDILRIPGTMMSGPRACPMA